MKKPLSKAADIRRELSIIPGNLVLANLYSNPGNIYTNLTFVPKKLNQFSFPMLHRAAQLYRSVSIFTVSH